MVSNTKQTERRRRIKAATVGRAQKKQRARAGTPKFPIHLEEGTPAAKPAPAAKAAPAKPAAAKPAPAAVKKA